MAPVGILDHAYVMRRNTSQRRDLLRSLVTEPIRGLIRFLVTDPTPARLVVCQRCDADFVVPVAWEDRGEAGWWIRLRCGGCGFFRDTAVSNEQVKCFQRELDRGVDEIAAAVDRHEREVMIADVDALTLALQHDLIDADSFSR
jgi:hypothetical protein